MAEMIRRARESRCECLTADVGAPDFYRRFGYTPALELDMIDCDVPAVADRRAVAPFAPADFDPMPDGTLWIGRFVSPTQKWQEIADSVRRRDALLPEHAGRPKPVGVASDALGYVGFLVPEWRNPARAEVLCWSQMVTGEIVSELLSQARAAGYTEARLLCHPDVTHGVRTVCGGRPSGSWPIWARPVRDCCGA
jgi:hypothetical protein